MGAVTLLQKWQLLQAIIVDPGLSATAKLVAARLLYHHSSQTGRCSPSYQTLADGVALKRRAVINAVQELESRNWLSVGRVKGGDPAAARGFVTNAFRINFGRLSEAPPVHGDALPPGAPSCTPPGASNDTPPVHDGTLPPVHGGAPNSGKDTGKGNREESPPTPSPFAEFWDVYPKQEGEDAARREYDRVIREQRATHDQIIEGVTAYAVAREGEPAQYTTSPGRWLKDGRWRDRPARATPPRRRSFSATRDWLPARMDIDE